MRVSVFLAGLMTMLASLSSSVGHAQRVEEVNISIRLIHSSMNEAILEIERLTPFKFLARAEDVEGEQNINLDVKNQSVASILMAILKGRGLEYKQVGINIVIKKDRSRKREAPLPATEKTSVRFAVSGTVRSSKTGETILGATIRITDPPTGTATNEYGFYSLTLPSGGPYRMTVSAVGFKPEVEEFQLNADLVQNIKLDEEVRDLQAYTVTATPGSRSLQSPQMGLEKLSIREANKMPVIFGERDILKTIQLLPGIKPAGDGNSGFYVRGGTADQNLILLDEATVYNPTHLLGFFSTFNSDAIKNVSVFKGDMPAQYGGRLSSVVDVKMNDGNNKNYGVNGGIGLISSRLMVEGPIQQDKSSFLVSGRRTYLDQFLKLSPDSNINRSRLYFYDLNVKANYIFGNRDRLYLSGYFGRDVLRQSNRVGINWGNTTATLRWNHLFNKRLFSNTSLIYSNYDYRINANQDGSDFDIFSQIRDWNLKEDLQWNASSDHSANFGFNTIFHTIRPGEITAIGNDPGINSQALPRRYSLESAAYVTDTWKASTRFNLTFGMRLSVFSVLGKGEYYKFDANGNITDTMIYRSGQFVKTYVNPEPRIAASFQLTPMTSLKASYVRNTQHLHLISNSTSNNPTDKWVANTNVIKPEIADQWSAGYYKNLSGNRYELSVETYFKTMQNQIDYRNGANVFTNRPIESELLFGKGRAFGVEAMLKKRVGRLTGWVAYTLSKTERQIDGINDGRWYKARQDRTHDIAIVGVYEFNRKWTFSADWVFYTGEAVTFPDGKYTLNGNVYFYYTNRNGYREPNYHRLDLSATKQLKKTHKFSGELVFSLYNAYGRKNPYQIDFRQGKTDPNITEAVETSLFTFVPTVSYNFKF
ncbi:MAG: TonB-dependent receptor [Bacteroidota bacterium]|nr:TonB-dependent receptor [Bacteroidota bacterium]